MTTKTLLFTGLALIAFAANSVLCRLALSGESIDPASFTVIRLLSGALILFALIKIKPKTVKEDLGKNKGSWSASLALFTYAACFSYAYISLDTGTGALVLFGSIQITMVLMAIWRGDRLLWLEWLGLGLSFLGFVYLMLPDVESPSWLGFILMVMSGIAWSVYTFKGYGSVFPLMDTAYNFVRTMPFIGILFLSTAYSAVYSLEGVLLAIASGAIASGLGYTLWYIALAGLASTQAAVLQLLVPMIAAVGGVLFIGERLDMRLIVSACIVLGGILVVIFARQKNS